MNIFKILDHARQRKAWVENAVNLSQQISENILLISLVRTGFLPATNFNHWKTELLAHTNNIASRKLKGNNSHNSRFHALREAWNVDEINTDEWLYKNYFSGKMEAEGVSEESVSQPQVTSMYHTILNHVTSLIVKEATKTLSNYIKSL